MKGIRASEVRNYIRAKGDEGVMDVLVQMAERMSSLEQQQREVGASLLQMSQIVDQITTAAGMMRSQIENMQGEDDDSLPMASE